MNPAPDTTWLPVEREAFLAWLQQFDTDETLGMAAGYTAHPVAAYLNQRDGGLWCVEVSRQAVRLLNRQAPGHRLHAQEDWLLKFCWELKRGDSYREVTAVDCLAALGRVP